MKPEDVKPAKFKVHTIIYNNHDFTVAYGKWENAEIRIAMRWNGPDNKQGYPNQGKNPLWFQLPSDSIWTNEVLQTIDKIKDLEERIKELDSKLKP
jgi:hypothetical protein